ncbi:MAG: transporter substrate-binding domain-containing protein [Spirochaetes bacterium]|nr:transporter substrate-binding domain-containing protein [Spirochaetota bacterium]
MKKSAHYIYIFLIIFPSLIFGQTLTLVSLESPPAEYTENGIVSGKNVEIVKEALKRMGYDCTILLVPWIRALKMVEVGSADAIIDAAYNEERAEYLFYPDEVINIERWYFFKLKKNNFSIDENFDNAKYFRLGITRGFEYGGFIQDAIKKEQFKIIDKVPDNESNLTKLVSNRFDMFIGMKLTVTYYAKKLGYEDIIDIVPMTETNQPYLLNSSKTYLAFSKKTMTQKIVNQFSDVIRQMKKDGIFAAIEQKYD